MVHVHFIKINATWIICNTLGAFSHMCYRFIIIHNRIFKLFRKSCLFFWQVLFFFSDKRFSNKKAMIQYLKLPHNIYKPNTFKLPYLFRWHSQNIPDHQMTTNYTTSNHYYTMRYYCIRTHPLWPPLPWWWTDAVGTVCWPPSHFWFALGWRVRSPDWPPHLLSTVSKKITKWKLTTIN